MIQLLVGLLFMIQQLVGLLFMMQQVVGLLFMMQPFECMGSSSCTHGRDQPPLRPHLLPQGHTPCCIESSYMQNTLPNRASSDGHAHSTHKEGVREH